MPKPLLPTFPALAGPVYSFSFSFLIPSFLLGQKWKMADAMYVYSFSFSFLIPSFLLAFLFLSHHAFWVKNGKWPMRCMFIHSPFLFFSHHSFWVKNGSWSSFLLICSNSRKKSMASFLHFPLDKLHTFLAKPHSQSTWLAVSGFWQQISHFASTLARLFNRFSLVGIQLEKALHKKVRTFGGTLSQGVLRGALLGSTSWTNLGFFMRTATRYAVRTVNFLALFSCHTRTSLEFTLFSGVSNISSHVLCAKVANTLPRSHCPVSSSMSSQTRIFSVGSCRKIGAWGSQTCLATSIVRPSPTCHLDPSLMMSLAASNDLHTKEGLGPSSAAKKELRGKYRALYTLWKSEYVLWINLQACFAGETWQWEWVGFLFICLNYFQT